MKVLFISRATLYTDKGGDTIQVINTAHYLQNLGIDVTIRLCNETIDYSGFDLLHFFNIIRPADILIHIQRSGKPFVISTIYVDYAEYEKTVRGGVAGFVFRTFSPDLIEYAKVLARALINGEKIISPSYVLLGHSRSIKKIIRNAAMLLPNSENEYLRLLAHYHTKGNYRVIPNAINPSLFSIGKTELQRDNQLILCVGRIEGRKNQLNLIRAVNNTAYRLILIGSPSPNQRQYYAACEAEAGPNVSFIDVLPQEELVRYYQLAKVHVLASWFETTGLSSLEAAAMGCNIVVTEKGDTREYFENYAYYCDPSSPTSIQAAIDNAARAAFDPRLQEKINSHLTWEQTALKTLAAYQEIIRPV
ncbi:glycosyltransferase family 4 protein [Paraflavitalea pollutisoli]|uniref:glycosyltransferase family 4 protein n=1 Tax=Paraflavitalea pollutisoli TaxID=3034143 RepID=UPI0023ECC409|nr:glycosyltransferase family 4 protein [Paraflavitalea sp. H1-2-19X]